MPERYRENQYFNSKNKLVRFKGQTDLFSRQRGRESYLQFTVKKWMKLLDQKSIKGKVCIHDINMVLGVTDAETMEMWLRELAIKHDIPEDKIQEHITKVCYPVEKFLHNGEERKMPHFLSECSSAVESSWFARYYWAIDYVIQGKVINGKGKGRAKPYTQEENRENWQITKSLKEYEEHFGHPPGFIQAPGVPHRIRPEGTTWPKPLEND